MASSHHGRYRHHHHHDGHHCRFHYKTAFPAISSHICVSHSCVCVKRTHKPKWEKINRSYSEIKRTKIRTSVRFAFGETVCGYVHRASFPIAARAVSCCRLLHGSQFVFRAHEFRTHNSIIKVTDINSSICMFPYFRFVSITHQWDHQIQFFYGFSNCAVAILFTFIQSGQHSLNSIHSLLP